MLPVVVTGRKFKYFQSYSEDRAFENRILVDVYFCIFLVTVPLFRQPPIQAFVSRTLDHKGREKISFHSLSDHEEEHVNEDFYLENITRVTLSNQDLSLIHI